MVVSDAASLVKRLKLYSKDRKDALLAVQELVRLCESSPSERTLLGKTIVSTIVSTIGLNNQAFREYRQVILLCLRCLHILVNDQDTRKMVANQNSDVFKSLMRLLTRTSKVAAEGKLKAVEIIFILLKEENLHEKLMFYGISPIIQTLRAPTAGGKMEEELGGLMQVQCADILRTMSSHREYDDVILNAGGLDALFSVLKSNDLRLASLSLETILGLSEADRSYQELSTPTAISLFLGFVTSPLGEGAGANMIPDTMKNAVVILLKSLGRFPTEAHTRLAEVGVSMELKTALISAASHSTSNDSIEARIPDVIRSAHPNDLRMIPISSSNSNGPETPDIKTSTPKRFVNILRTPSSLRSGRRERKNPHLASSSLKRDADPFCSPKTPQISSLSSFLPRSGTVPSNIPSILSLSTSTSSTAVAVPIEPLHTRTPTHNDSLLSPNMMITKSSSVENLAEAANIRGQIKYIRDEIAMIRDTYERSSMSIGSPESSFSSSPQVLCGKEKEDGIASPLFSPQLLQKKNVLPIPHSFSTPSRTSISRLLTSPMRDSESCEGELEEKRPRRACNKRSLNDRESIENENVTPEAMRIEREITLTPLPPTPETKKRKRSKLSETSSDPALPFTNIANIPLPMFENENENDLMNEDETVQEPPKIILPPIVEKKEDKTMDNQKSNSISKTKTKTLAASPPPTRQRKLVNTRSDPIVNKENFELSIAVLQNARESLRKPSQTVRRSSRRRPAVHSKETPLSFQKIEQNQNKPVAADPRLAILLGRGAVHSYTPELAAKTEMITSALKARNGAISKRRRATGRMRRTNSRLD